MAISKKTRQRRTAVRFIVGTAEELAGNLGEEAITLEDAQIRLGASRRALAKAVRTGQLRSVGQIGNANLYRTSDLSELLDPERPPRDARDPEWAALSLRLIEAAGGCAVCCRPRDLRGHHIIPVATAPERLLDESNVIVLCEDDHLHLGHVGRWHMYNPHVVEHARMLRANPEARPVVEKLAEASALRSRRTAASTGLDDAVIQITVVGDPTDLLLGTGQTAVTATEIAAAYGLSKARVFQYVEGGEFKPIATRGNIFFFDAEQVRQYFAGRFVFDPAGYRNFNRLPPEAAAERHKREMLHRAVRRAKANKPGAPRRG